MDIKSLFVAPITAGAIPHKPDDLIERAARLLDDMNDELDTNGQNTVVIALGTAAAAHVQLADYLRTHDRRYKPKTKRT